MIQLLYTVIGGEMVLILLLLFKTPLRKVVIMGLDKVKRGGGPVVVKTVGATIFVVLLSGVYNMVNMRGGRLEEGAVPNPTEMVLMAFTLLESTLMGFLLFLALMLDRLHHYIRELHLLRKATEAAKKPNHNGTTDEEVKTLREQLSGLKSQMKKSESEFEAKAAEAKAAGAEAEALKKQSEGFLLEYDRLLADNQHLRNQLESANPSSLHAEDKKRT